MKIAFDATVLHGRKSGVGYYCEELLKGLLSIDHHDEYFVFSHRPLKLDGFSATGNLQVSESGFFPVRAVYLHALLPSILNNARPDVCHYTNFLAPFSERRPYVVTIHDMGMVTLRNSHPIAKRLYTRPLVPRVARHAKLILTNSEYSKWEIIRHLAIPESRIRVTPLAASPEFKPMQAPRGDPYFLYVGNIEPRKNLERLLEAFARLPIKTHHLVIVGNRWYRGARVEEKAKAIGLNGRVKFLGYVDRADLPGLFSGADAFVYPSLLEGFGLPVVEAMACGTPVIAANNSSLREVAADAALLIDPLDVGSMTDALALIAGDDALRQRLSSRGLDRAAEFSWTRTAQLTLDAYREALDSRPMPVSARALGVPDRRAIKDAIERTVAYSCMFDYPLQPDELHERLIGLKIEHRDFERVLHLMEYKPDQRLMETRTLREQISDDAISAARDHLRTLASMPFVRMMAFSGSTAHRNMTTDEDLDLFVVVADGRLWSFFLAAMVWARFKGLRKHLCINYVLSDDALPIFERDMFTAQQVASLKPIFGKPVYDRFVESNPFVRRHFPNFDPLRHREAYREITPSPIKAVLETVLSCGAVQVFEGLSRFVLGKYLHRKVKSSSACTTEVMLDRKRLKLHMTSHKPAILNRQAQ